MRVGSLACRSDFSAIARDLGTLSTAAAEAESSGTPTTGIAQCSDFVVPATRANIALTF